jgi:mycothiol synthase
VSLTRRPATTDDAKALLDLYGAYDLAEFGECDMDLGEIEGMLAVETSEGVVAEDERVVGFADLAENGETETLVDPSYADAQRLHVELLTWAVQRASERGISRLEHWAGTTPDVAAPVLTEAGFEPARTLWRMHRDLAGELPDPMWPSGVTLRPFDLERDGREVWQVVMTSFAGEFGSHQRPYDEWVTRTIGSGYTAVSVEENGAIIGVATTGVRGGDGHIGQLAVLPEQRGRGIALALLHECFRRDAAAGRNATTLGVDGENSNARRLYDKAGMRVTKEYRRWERNV